MVVHALESSYAAKRAPAELHEAERTAEAIEKLLRPADARDPSPPIDIYLTDQWPVAGDRSESRWPMPGGDGVTYHLPLTTDHQQQRAIFRVIAPEDPGEGVLRPLVRLLVAEWFSPAAASVPLFTGGIAGVLSGRMGTGPSLAEADDAVRAQLEAGNVPSIFSLLSAQSPKSDADDPGLNIATSFVGFLLKTSGEEALRRFLAAYDPERRDQAAALAYQQPLGTLEEAWIAGLRRRGLRGSALPLFLRRLLPLVKPYRLQVGELFLYSLFSVAYSFVAPLGLKFLIDTVIPEGVKTGSANLLVLFIVVLLGIHLLDAAVSMRQNYLDVWLSQRVLMDLREKLFAHLQRLAHNFYSEAKVGDVMVRLSRDVDMAQAVMSLLISSWLSVVLSTIAAVGILLALSPLLSVLSVLAVPLFSVSYFTLRKRLQQAGIEQQTAEGTATAFVQENLSAYPVVRAYGMEQRAEAQYNSRLLAVLKAALRMAFTNALLVTSTGFSITLGQLIVLGVGGYLVITGQISLGDLLAFSLILPSLFMPVAALSGLGRAIESASGSLRRVDELIEQPVTVADRPGAAPLPPLSREVRLERVTFAYSSDRTILEGVDFAVPAGAHVAIVGPSGSGKSTIANLLLRFWDPQAGRVLFDGHDLRDVSLASMRGQSAIVFQDTFIFDTTVRENIAVGRPEATDAEIVEAARGARLDSFIAALPAGYDTVLGERGVRMSGGQRQRLSIARALLRNPALLVLDEATSALDAQTEKDILDTLAGFMQGRTTISITHRLTVAATADRIFVMDAGRLVEQGTHAELLAAEGLYSRLYNEQVGHLIGLKAHVEVEAAHLRGIPLFAALPAEALASLAGQLLPERYPAGEDVVRQGEPGDKLYIISRGRTEVLLGDAQGQGQRRINVLNKGDYFGEMALLAGGIRTTTVRTTEPTELYSLSQTDFQALLAGEPLIREAVYETMAARRAALTAAS